MKDIFKISAVILSIFLINSCKKDKPIPPILTTTDITAISYTSAISGGEVINEGGTPVISRGVCWKRSANPTTPDSKTTNGSGPGSFSSNLTGLQPGTIYYVRSYAANSVGTSYGNEINFTTQTSTVPSLITVIISSVTGTSAISGGNVTSDGGDSITARGVCWGTMQFPTISDNKSIDGYGTGVYTSSITGLTIGTIYYVRAYASNSSGTSYGSQLNFKTLSLPTVTTMVITGITQATAIAGGNVIDGGGTTITARGVCWSNVQNPVVSNSKTIDGTGRGPFSTTLTGLTGNTTYYVRAYATNSVGISYGDMVNFITEQPTLALITTNAISNVGISTASCGGNITMDGGAPITARGICWNNSPNPTLLDNYTIDGTGSGNFSSIISGLTSYAIYYVRAYASNNVGTSYGDQKSFTSSTVADLSGNIYRMIQIGNQIWMMENLKTIKYKDDTSIPLVPDPTLWGTLSTPGYCWYANNESYYKAKSGAIYNWYAVNAGKLCPNGWHVPSDSEWTILTNYLGGTTVAGGKLKETGTTNWQSPNAGATNESGFTALPCGERGVDSYSNNVFSGYGGSGWWWTSTVYSDLESYYRAIYNSTTQIQRYHHITKSGFSVRCIKD